MSTNALIGKERENNKVEYIYCHWDGYIEGAGDILARHYDVNKVEGLLEKGDMSVLRPKVEDCVFYRDRGDENIDSETIDIEGYLDGSKTSFYAEYRYLFDKKGDLYCYYGEVSKTPEKIKL